MITPFLAVGWDHSLNHTAAIVLNSQAEIVDLRYLTPRAAAAKAGRDRAERLPPTFLDKDRDATTRKFERLAFLRLYLPTVCGQIDDLRRASVAGCRVYVGFEDYALRAAQGAHQLGEAGALLRLALFDRPGFYLRPHDPTSVKMFATGKGTAEKSDIAAAVRREWHVDFTKYGAGKDGPAEDLADAYVLARMVLAEVELRAGRTDLADLPERERKLFLRVTPSQPVNVLARPWVECGAFGSVPGWAGTGR